MNPERKTQLKKARLEEVEGLKNNWLSADDDSRAVAFVILLAELNSLKEGNNDDLRRNIVTECAALVAMLSPEEQEEILEKARSVND